MVILLVVVGVLAAFAAGVAIYMSAKARALEQATARPQLSEGARIVSGLLGGLLV